MVYAEANSTSLDMIQSPGQSFKILVEGRKYTYSTQHTGYHLYGVNEHGIHFKATEILPIMWPSSKNSVITLSKQLNAFGLHIFLKLNAKSQVNRMYNRIPTQKPRHPAGTLALSGTFWCGDRDKH